MKVLILSGPNHSFEKSATIIHDFLAARGDMAVTLTDDKGVLASPKLREFDVGSSRVDLQACKLEYSIVSPK